MRRRFGPGSLLGALVNRAAPPFPCLPLESTPGSGRSHFADKLEKACIGGRGPARPRNLIAGFEG